MNNNAFLLVDCNNFFCSCERVFNPKLANLPVAVLSSNDGCIIARSQEVKKLGIPMGAPYFQYKKVLHDHNVQVFSANFQLYSDMSRRVMHTIQSMVQAVEVYSIDEAFVLLKDYNPQQLHSLAVTMRRKIYQWTGIPVSIGIGSTKTLAKMANHLAKQGGAKYDYIFDICSAGKQEAILADFPVGDIWGIGSKGQVKLNVLGINNALALRNADVRCIRRQFSVVGERIVRELNGISCLSLDNLQPKKSIRSTRSFGQAVTTKVELAEALAYHAARVAKKLRQQNSAVKMIYAYIRTNYFQAHHEFYQNSATYEFAVPTADTSLLIKAAKICLEKIYRSGYRYHKAGVMLMDLVPQRQKQVDLFSSHDSAKSSALLNAVDLLNDRFGKDAVTYAAQGTNKQWAAKRGKCSPRYTTNWQELAVVRA